MKAMFEKHKKTKKILLCVFCFALLTTKIIYDFSPYLFIKSALVNTLDKYKSSFDELFDGTNRIRMDISSKIGNADLKKFYTFFDDRFVGFSFDGPDSLYYTLPVDKIKNILKSDNLNSLPLPLKFLNKTTNTVSILPALFSLKLSENVNSKFLAKTFLNAELIRRKGTYISREKSFSFMMPSKSISKMINSMFFSNTSSDKNLTSILTELSYLEDGHYLFDIEISDNTIKNIKCITPYKNKLTYCIQISFDYPKIYLDVETMFDKTKKNLISIQADFYQTESQKAVELSIKNDMHNQQSQLLIFNLISENNYKDNKYQEKSLYSLTVGEFIEIAKKVCKDYKSVL